LPGHHRETPEACRSVERVGAGAGAVVPEAQRAVAGGGEDVCAIRRVRAGTHRGGVARESAELFPGDEVPLLQGEVVRGEEDTRAIWRVGAGGHAGKVVSEAANLLAGAAIPLPERAV